MTPGAKLNLLDLAVLAVMVMAGFGGYRVGLLTRVSGWVGWLLGLVVASAIAPSVLQVLQGPDPQLRLVIVVGLFLLVASLGAALGELAGASLRRLLPPGGLRQADRAAGAGAGALGVLVVLWLLFPVLAEVPGGVARLTRNSVVLQVVDRVAPNAPGPLRSLREMISDADFPQVFAQLRPAPSTGLPPAQTALTPAVAARVEASTVKVSGTACGRVLEGSGFTPAAELVVTNAHVVAGVDRPQVRRPDGRRLSGSVIVFDPARDLAVLRVPGLGQSPLPVRDADVGDVGAVFGHPGGQEPVEVSPARIEGRVNALGRDLYNSSVTRRDVLVLAAELRPGDSGGPVVDTGGGVVGVAFAIAPDNPSTAYALARTELAAVLSAPRASADTGPCLR